jgi:hypothetical protein
VHIEISELIKWLAGIAASALVAVLGYFGSRTVTRIDEDMKNLDQRVTDLESLKASIMLRPDVLALYADQKEEFREKFKELRDANKDLRDEIGKKLDYVINRLDHRAKNERADD